MDVLRADVADVSFSAESGERLELSGVDRTFADLRSGNDRAELVGGAGSERLGLNGQNADFNSMLQFLRVRNFQDVSFDGNGGDDIVDVSGPVDLLAAIGDQATVVLERHRAQLTDFSALDIESVDGAIIDLDLDSLDFTTNLGGF